MNMRFNTSLLFLVGTIVLVLSCERQDTTVEYETVLVDEPIVTDDRDLLKEHIETTFQGVIKTSGSKQWLVQTMAVRTSERTSSTFADPQPEARHIEATVNCKAHNGFGNVLIMDITGAFMEDPYQLDSTNNLAHADPESAGFLDHRFHINRHLASLIFNERVPCPEDYLESTFEVSEDENGILELKYLHADGSVEYVLSKSRRN